MIKQYLLKVWATALIAAPVIIFILMLSNTHDPDRDRNDTLVGISFIVTGLYGAVLTIPTFAICYLLFPALYQKFKNPFHFRIVISFIAAAGVFIIIYFVLTPLISLIYGICFFISGLIYKITPSQKPPPINK